MGLYVSRLRRLVPLYISLIPVFLFLVAIMSEFQLRSSIGNLMLAIARWSSVDLFGRPPINGIEDAYTLNPAIWTLKFEWMFYIILPIIALFVTPVRAIGLGSIIIVAFAFYPEHAFILNFVFGGFAALLLFHVKEMPLARTHWTAMAACASVVAIGLSGAEQYSLRHSIFLFPLFVIVCYGNSLLAYPVNADTRYM